MLAGSQQEMASRGSRTEEGVGHWKERSRPVGDLDSLDLLIADHPDGNAQHKVKLDACPT